jgi:hypothetical protein
VDIVKSVVVQPLEKRQRRLRSVQALWLVLIAISLIGVLVVNVGLLAAQSQTGRAVQVVVRVGIHLIPPVVWVGAILIVALWLFVMVRVWRP